MIVTPDVLKFIGIDNTWNIFEQTYKGWKILIVSKKRWGMKAFGFLPHSDKPVLTMNCKQFMNYNLLWKIMELQIDEYVKPAKFYF